MAEDISPSNEKSQQEIFLPENGLPINGLLKCGMAKRTRQEPREIFLGDWLEFFELGPTEAARIAGCSQSYISNISRGARTNINALFLLRLSEHLDLNINDFFRPLPSQTQLNALKKLSPRAQAAVLERKQQKN